MAIANIAPEEARRAYLREWKKAHPDKVREYNAKYWAKRAARMAPEQADRKEVTNDGSNR